mmetsp:Transcript_12728/g.32258  ORF Transcript_12728/g.32258 Transcript_12728/m.32258 type:complete len:415 (-) Transcript_12728:43-1287(-)
MLPLGARLAGLALVVGVLGAWIVASRTAQVPLVALDGSAASRVALLKAAELGIFRVRAAPHLSALDIERALHTSAELFSRGEAEKRAWRVVRFPPVHGKPAPIARGYIPFGGESGVSGSFFEMKQGFAYSSGCKPAAADEESGARPMEFCSAWPEPGHGPFKDAVSRLLEGSHAIALEVMRELALALRVRDGGESLVASLVSGLPISLMRLFHYHDRHHCQQTNRTECAARGSRALIGSSPHTDWSALTIIAEGSHGGRPGWLQRATNLIFGAGGLQFRARGSARWQDARTEAGEVFVIIGDLLSIGSDGRLHSPVHRVLLPSERGRTRTSFTFFANPRGTDMIASWVRMLQTGEAAPDVDEVLARARERASGVHWNTLLSGADARAHEPFDAILLHKWRGVSTLDSMNPEPHS